MRPLDTNRAHRMSARDLALVAVFAALIAALGLPGTIALFGNAVPITAQTLGVMLAGSILGARRGLYAMLVFMALVAAGLPLLAGGRGGLGAFTGPSSGYLIGFAFGAWVTGWLTERLMASGRYTVVVGLVANVVGGILVVYAFGIPLQAWRTGTSGMVATAVAALVFLPGDALKAVVATLVAKGVHAGYPMLGREIAARERERARARAGGAGETDASPPGSGTDEPDGRTGA